MGALHPYSKIFHLNVKVHKYMVEGNWAVPEGRGGWGVHNQLQVADRVPMYTQSGGQHVLDMNLQRPHC